jgi:hypothetical protein
MTIEVAKLVNMLKLETAASNWFSKLSPAEQHAYLKAHPSSSMTGTVRADHRQGGKQNEMSANMETLGNKHHRAARSHWSKFQRHANHGKEGATGPKAQAHATAAQKHEEARGHYYHAMNNFGMGKLEKGKLHALLATKLAGRAHVASAVANKSSTPKYNPD